MSWIEKRVLIGQTGLFITTLFSVPLRTILKMSVKLYQNKSVSVCSLRCRASSQVSTSPPGMDCRPGWVGIILSYFENTNILIYVYIIYCFGTRQWPGPDSPLLTCRRGIHASDCENNKRIVGRPMQKHIQSLKIYLKNIPIGLV